MRLLLTTAAVTVALLCLSPGVAKADDCKGSMTVKVEHVSSQSNSVTVVDAISGNTKISGTMKAHEKRSISICKNDAGYGRIKYKKQGQSSWTQSSLLKPGDTIKI